MLWIVVALVVTAALVARQVSVFRQHPTRRNRFTLSLYVLGVALIAFSIVLQARGAVGNAGLVGIAAGVALELVAGSMTEWWNYQELRGELESRDPGPW